MRSSTALDALIAELLGDVGALHNEVKALHESVQAAAKAEMGRTYRVAAVVALAALLGSLAGGAVVAFFILGPH
jgi:hypothetical protein